MYQQGLHTLLPRSLCAVTSTILDKQLRSLLADIMRAQAQQPPPGFDPEQVAAVQVAANSSSAAAAAAVAAGGEGGEQTLRSKLQDYVMLNDGQQQASPMSLDALKEQVGGRAYEQSGAGRELALARRSNTVA